MVKIYRKLPAEVEAIQYDGKNIAELNRWSDGNVSKERNDNHPTIETLSGFVMLHVGYYVIKGVEGEFYPCKPEIFKETYEEV